MYSSIIETNNKERKKKPFSEIRSHFSYFKSLSYIDVILTTLVMENMRFKRNDESIVILPLYISDSVVYLLSLLLPVRF